MRARDLLPGLLVAATGVGAGDLVTASLAGSELGLAVLWAAPVGAVLKFALTEGLARWQLATGTTLLAGWRAHLGPLVRWTFLVYLVLWSVVVGGALVSACGIAGQALLPFDDPATGKIVWGVVHSLVGLALARAGGLALFERAMSACILVMVVAVLLTAVWLAPPLDALLAGLVPRIPAGGSAWVLGVLGGVGGTVTVLSYGYWIAEHGRRGEEQLALTRVDLGLGYAVTALFGMAMVVIGARLELDGRGAGVAVAIADELAAVLGTPGRWLFLAGFWGAVFSSLLGVWQGVPYLFADAWSRTTGAADRGDDNPPVDTRVRGGFQLLLATVPLLLLGTSLRAMTLAYAVLGALFMPFLAGTLLLMLGRRGWAPRSARNGWLATSVLAATLVFFAWQGLAGLLGR